MMNLRISAKLIVGFLAVGLIPFAIIGLIALNSSSTALEKQAFNQLESLRQIKKFQIEKFFGERRGDMGVLVDMVGAFRQEAFNKLTAVRQIKKNAIESYFQTINDQVVTLSKNRMVVDAMRNFTAFESGVISENGLDAGKLANMRTELRTYYAGQFGPEYEKQNGKKADIDGIMGKLSDSAVALQYYYIQANKNPLGSKHMLDKAAGDSSAYSSTHAKVHPSIRTYLEKFGYYDIFMVDAKSGRVVYSVYKELDYNTSLLNGPWADTNFAEAFKQAKNLKDPDSAILIDFKQYTPSYSAPAGFIGSPIYDGGELLGVLVFQMPLDRITTVMSERAGLGKTGETYLIGPDNLMRSDSYLDQKNRTVVQSFRNPAKGSVTTVAAKEALAGKAGTKIVLDYFNNPVLSAYTPVKVGGLTWGLMAEIDVGEAFVPHEKGKKKDFYAEYIDKYGYYDLFLMNPDGYVFYTATREADYQTNMVSGKYKDSGLGELTRSVLQTQKFGLADFAPYAPSNGDPAGFIAQPVVNGGQVELVVGLQLSLGAINDIMSERAGLGESGETYLIGSDKLMRSDSFLDPKYHTVKASFANREKGLVDTEAAREVLSGKTDQKIIIDYNGNPVLSAYTPIKVGDTTWGLLAEIDESEAFAATNTLQMLMMIIAGVGVVVIAGIGWFMARNVATPIVSMTNAMGELANNDLEVEIPAQDRQDEIGDMAEAVQVFKDNAIEVERLKSEQEASEKRAEEEKTRLMNAMADDFQASVGGVVESVSSASTQMQSSAQSMSATADQTNAQATTVAAASEEASTNVQTVAAAAEELSSSIGEIGRQVQQSTEITASAVTEAERANEMVQGLAQAAGKIGEVVSLITDIAEQTNLLALNATIEAARAGDAGKGFAVVASEVKNLANQTAKATEEISAQIGGIQSATKDSVDAIGGISKTIGEVSEIASAIAAAVEEQSAATQEIARNVEQASAGTSEVSANITGVTTAAGETGQAAGEILNAASELSQQSELLRGEVDKFLTQVRSA